MKTLLKAIGSAILIIILLVVTLFVVTRGDYPVAPLVTQDLSLQSHAVAGVRLHTRVVDGPPNADTIVVLHGGPGADFRSLQGFDALSDAYRLIYYDQRGAGLSERVDSAALTLSDYVSELDAVINLFSPDKAPILVGHSWGAILATAYIGQYPENAKKAVLIEPGFLNSAGQIRWVEQSKTYMSGLTYWTEAMLTGFRAQHVTGPDPDAGDDFLIGHMVDVFASHPNNPYHCGSGYTAPHWRFGARSSRAMEALAPNELDSIASNAMHFSGPVMLMAGACNSWTGAPLQRLHLQLFEDALLTIVENAGHNVLWDNPMATLAAIRSFLLENRE